MTDSPQQTLALARTAAGAVRSLNHATLGGQGLDQPADAYELLGELSLAAAGLPQLLAQAGRWLAARLSPGSSSSCTSEYRNRPVSRARSVLVFLSSSSAVIMLCPFSTACPRIARVRLAPDTPCQAFERQLQAIPAVLSAVHVTGHVDYELRLACRDVADLRAGLAVGHCQHLCQCDFDSPTWRCCACSAGSPCSPGPTAPRTPRS